MKYYRLFMSKGNEFTLSEDKLKEILTSENQVVFLQEDDILINKAHIVCADRDSEAEKEEQRRSIAKLESPTEKYLTKEEVDEKLERFKPDFLKEKGEL